MNTDGHAKGYEFDGLHSHFGAAGPLIPIFSRLVPCWPWPRDGRSEKYNFMVDSKYWSTLHCEDANMLNPYR